MVTAPRDGRLLKLERYPCNEDKRVRFIGRWAENDGTGWWHDQTGKRVTRVHSWFPLQNNQTEATASV